MRLALLFASGMVAFPFGIDPSWADSPPRTVVQYAVPLGGDEPEPPFMPLFRDDPGGTAVTWVAADKYFEVGTALTGHPMSGYRWETWALNLDGSRIGRIARSGPIASRRLLDPKTGTLLGILDATAAPDVVVFHDRRGKRLNLDLTLREPGAMVEPRSPFSIHRVLNRGDGGRPTRIEPEPIGWLDEGEGLLLDADQKPLARLENARLLQEGLLAHRHVTLLAGNSLTHQYMTESPNAELGQRIDACFQVIETKSLQAKLLLAELATRWLHLQTLLEKSEPRFRQMLEVDPKRLQAVLNELVKANLDELNDLWKPGIQAVLWEALAAAEPRLRYYVGGVRLAGLQGDPEVLEHTLRLLKAFWVAEGKPTVPVRRAGAFEEWMRAGLIDAIRLQLVRTPEDAAAFANAYPTGPAPNRGGERRVGDPPVLRTASPVALRAAGWATAVDRAIHLGAALQRAGRDVTFWSIAAVKPVDETTKTIAQEPLLVFPFESGKDAVAAVGADYFLSTLTGKRIADAGDGVGVYRFASPAELKSLLEMRGQFKVDLVELIDGQGSSASWGAALQAALASDRSHAPNLTGILLEGRVGDSWAHFNARTSESFAVQAQARFVRLVKDNGIELSVARVRDGAIVDTTRVANVDKRDPDDVLPKHEAMIGRCFQMMPAKMERGLRAITLQTEPILEPLRQAKLDQGRWVFTQEKRPLLGRGWNDRIMLAAPAFPEAFHEFMHRWALARTEPFTVGAWTGQPVEIFNEISWQRDGFEWVRRGGDDLRVEDFFWEYGATHVNEDIAVVGQFYGALPRQMRQQVRAELKKGNFVPAAKYLFFKSIAFLDTDGRMLELEVDELDPAFTFAEFGRAARAFDRRPTGLHAEQKRLVELVQRMEELHAQMIGKKTIVSSR